MAKVNYKEDILETKKLVSAFVKKYGSILGLDEKKLLSTVVASEYLGYGAGSVVGFSISSNISDKLKVGETKPNTGMIWLISSINPNGVTGKGDVARTYTVHVELKGKKRITLRSYDDRSNYFKIYDYGRTIEEVLDRVSDDMPRLRLLKERDELKFSNFNYDLNKDKFDNGGGVGVSSEINSDDNGIGTGADMNTDQYEKGGRAIKGFVYTIGGL